MEYKLRKVCKDDKDLLFQWANDTQCRKNSFHQDVISYEEHCDWFATKLADEMCDMYIYCEQGLPIGQIRIDWDKNLGCISYFVIRGYRGQGHGSNMLKLVEHEMTGKGKRLTGCVKQDNIASQIAFKKNGFNETEEDGYYRYDKIIEE